MTKSEKEIREKHIRLAVARMRYQRHAAYRLSPPASWVPCLMTLNRWKRSCGRDRPLWLSGT